MAEIDQGYGEPEGGASRTTIREMLGLLWEVLSVEIRGQRRLLLAGLAAGLVSAGCGLLVPYQLKEIIDRHIVTKQLAGFLTQTGLLFFALLAFYLFWSLQAHFSTIASQQIFYAFRCRLLGGILNKREAFYATFGMGDLVARLEGDVDIASEFFYLRVVPSLASLPYAAVIGVFIFLWDWRLGLGSALLVPSYLLILRATRDPLSRLARRARDLASRQAEVLLDLLGGHKTIRFYQQQERAVARFANPAGQYASANAKSLRAIQWTASAFFLCGDFLENSPLLFGGFLICAGIADISLGTRSTGLATGFSRF
jgi:ATP-binding cassette subfamily B protein